MTLNYHIVGDGPPLLLVHGMGVPFTIWENLLPELSPYYSCIMVEQLGHGDSPPVPDNVPYYAANANAIEVLRLKLGIERWDILGYSIGAWTAIEYSQCYPERVGHLALLCPAILPLPHSALLRGLTWLDGRLPELDTWILSGWRMHTLVRLLGFAGKDHPYARVWSQEITGQPVATIKRLLHDIPDAGRPKIVFPHIPVHFIWARNDLIAARPFRPRPVDHTIPGTHSAPMLFPAAVADEIINFLE